MQGQGPFPPGRVCGAYNPRMPIRTLVVMAVLACTAPLVTAQRTTSDRYSRYELGNPADGVYRVIDDWTVHGSGTFTINTAPGATISDLVITDRYSNEAVAGSVTDRGIVVPNLRQVPAPGEVRLRVQYTVRDRNVLSQSGSEAVFTLTTAGKRNAIVVPAGYELLESNVPTQVIEEDGRLNVTSWNTMPASVPIRLRMRRLPAANSAAPSVSSPPVMSPGSAATSPSNALTNARVSERAIQDREIVYFLQQPDTHSFRLYHDYTEARPGVSTYRNVVRGGSTVSDPSAILLDTGAALKVETLKEKDAEVVVIHFPPVEQGKNSRLRITETYTDPGRYGLVNGQLVWNRNFGRPANDVVLPDGWYLTDSSIPAVITQEPDGRTRLAFLNPRPDSIDVIVKARKRGGQ